MENGNRTGLMSAALGGGIPNRLLVGTCNTLMGLSLILGDAILEDLGHKLILNPGAITY